MNLIKKKLAPSIMATISISCFFLSSLAAAESENISVTNRSTQIISVQPPSSNFIVEPSTKITKYNVAQLEIQRKHWLYGAITAIEDSTLTITSTNNTPICTVKTHYSIAHQLQAESDNPKKCYAIVDYQHYPAIIVIDIVVS